MITLSVLDIPSFAMQTTGWKYVRVDRKSSQDLIVSDMKPTVSRHSSPVKGFNKELKV